MNALAKRLASTYTAPSGDQSHAAIITAVGLPPGLVTGFQSLITDWVNFFVCTRLANLTHRGLTSSSDINCQIPRGIQSGVVPATSENSFSDL